MDETSTSRRTAPACTPIPPLGVPWVRAGWGAVVAAVAAMGVTAGAVIVVVADLGAVPAAVMATGVAATRKALLEGTTSFCSTTPHKNAGCEVRWSHTKHHARQPLPAIVICKTC